VVKVILAFELLHFSELGMLQVWISELGMVQVWISFESHADPHFQTAMGLLFD